MVGILGAATMTFIRGPLASSVNINRQTLAEQHLQFAIRLAAYSAATQQADGGDCDGDGYIEPIPYVDAGAAPHPNGGGFIPSNVGAARRDPWGNDYGYCAWDHGASVNAAGCGGVGQARQVGGNTSSWEVIGVVSAGRDGVFQTACNDWTDTNADNVPDTPLMAKPIGSDDIVMTWTYAEATAGADGLWKLKSGDSTTAEIDRNLSVKDGGGAEQLSFDAATAALTIGAGGSGSFPNVKADFIGALTAPNIEFLSPINATADIQANGTTIIDAASGLIVSGEQDPKIGTVEAGKWCKTDAGGLVSCDQDLPNPSSIGTLEPDKWCKTDAGGVINCDQNPPITGGSGSGSLDCQQVYTSFATNTGDMALCPAGYAVTGGGCITNATNAVLRGSNAITFGAQQGWSCLWAANNQNRVQAVCCRIN